MKNVLIVDDVQVNRQILYSVIKCLPISVDFAADGLEACEKWMMRMHDLVFMDINMPEMDGIEASKCIKEMAGYNNENPTIVVVTASAEHDEECFNAGVSQIVRKPICNSTILKIAKKYLGVEELQTVN